MAGCASAPGHSGGGGHFESGFRSEPDQIWVGDAYWANRLQDWKIVNGRLACQNGRLPQRTVHLLRAEVTRTAPFEMRVRADLEGGTPSFSSAAGFLLGVGRDMDWRARAIVHQWPGRGGGLWAGMDGNGELFLRDNTGPQAFAAAPPGVLNRDGWTATATSADGQHPAAAAIDGDGQTWWHTRWRSEPDAYPHTLTLDLGRARRFAGCAILPRPGASAGRPRTVRLEVSDDGFVWRAHSEAVLPDRAALFEMAVPTVSSQHVRLTFVDGQNARPACAVAEVWLTPNPPTATTSAWQGEVELVLEAEPAANGTSATLRLRALDASTGQVLANIQRIVPSERVLGGVALTSHPGQADDGARFGFQRWQVRGPGVADRPGRGLGPVCASQYTLHDRTLKLTAQLLPLRVEDSIPCRLETLRDGEWIEVDSTIPSAPDYTARFRVENWDDEIDHEVRVIVPRLDRDGDYEESVWTARVRRDPRDKPEIVVAGMTGNHNNSHAIGGGWGLGAGGGRTEPNDWVQGMWFPHAELTEHVASHRPDLLFFSGDQIYEGKSPTGVDRDQLGLDYLYKWYLWCWAWQDLTREVPSVCIPDDHDVYQGNLWGQGGRKAPGADNTGGYVYPAWFVRMVETTQTSHLPDPVDPTPVAQDIGVYFTELVWGRVGFAILEDRKFKSGCAGVLPAAITPGRPDHVIDPAWEPARANVPGLDLLGERQLDWLESFAADWSGQDMKMALSQTIFASLSTHHGAGLRRYEADLDSNGWPQAGRRRALAVLRKGFALHLAGDQHLASVVHHGIDAQGDALWSFCVPSVANFYPRAWAPGVRGDFEPVPLVECLGPGTDGFGNLVDVAAVTNPGPRSGRTPTDLYDRMPGYGIVVVQKSDRTYRLECWPRHVDPTAAQGGQYEGWPVRVRQVDNFAPKPLGHLPRLRIAGLDNPVVTVYRQGQPYPIYSLRIRGREFLPPVYEPGPYRVTVGCPDLGLGTQFDNLQIDDGRSPPLQASF